MKDQLSNNENIFFLQTLKEYIQYLYEDEIKRAEGFHNVTKTYLLFIPFTFTVAIAITKFLKLTPAELIFENLSVIQMSLLGILSISLLLLIFSFIFTVLIIKGWKVERLTDPKIFIEESTKNMDIESLYLDFISDYSKATKRKSEVNDKKGWLLIRASFLYHLGLFSLLLTGFLYFFFGK